VVEDPVVVVQERPPTARRRRGDGGDGVDQAGGPPRELPAEVLGELAASVGPARSRRLAARLQAAAESYARDRYPDAFRLTRQLVDEAPDVAAVQELHGLVCYRLGRWRQAVRHLEAARRAGGDTDQLPVLMDCHRAQGHHRRVAELWDELRASGAGADVVVEGRLVLAADLADQGRLSAAIGELVRAGAARELRRPADRHVRQWYLLADLCERAGDVGQARRLFARVVAVDDSVADAAERLAALGGMPETAPRLGGGRPATLGELAGRRGPPPGPMNGGTG